MECANTKYFWQGRNKNRNEEWKHMPDSGSFQKWWRTRSWTELSSRHDGKDVSSVWIGARRLSRVRITTDTPTKRRLNTFKFVRGKISASNLRSFFRTLLNVQFFKLRIAFSKPSLPPSTRALQSKEFFNIGIIRTLLSINILHWIFILSKIFPFSFRTSMVKNSAHIRRGFLGTHHVFWFRHNFEPRIST